MNLSIFLGLVFALFERFGKGVVLKSKFSPPHVLKERLRRNTRFENSETFVLNRFPDISLEQCTRECSLRPGCKAVEYRDLAKYCSLHTAISSTEVSPGFLTASGFNEIVQCDSESCDDNEVCEISSGKCKVKECGYPIGDHIVIGNRFEVRDKIVAHTYGERTADQLTCTDSGEWKTSMGQFWYMYQGITCRDIRQRHSTVQTGVYVNQLNMTIYCDFDTDGGAWLVFQNRKDGSVDFYRNWEDYKRGFGDVSGEFWFGLEKLYTILRASSPTTFELRVDLEDWDGNQRYAAYSEFHINDGADGYRLHCANYTGTAGDALCRPLGPHSGYMFSTKDRDHDTHKGSCAKKFHGAWWYKNCFDANLNGRYHDDSEISVRWTGLIWQQWKGDYYSLKKTAMKMREKPRP